MLFLEIHEIEEINTTSSQNACQMYKLVNFWNLKKKNRRKYRITTKKLIFGQTDIKSAVTMASSKMMDTREG